MKASEKIKGIVFAYNTTGEYDMVRELGVEWMRLGIAFPWKDKMFGTLSEQYLEDREEIRRTHDAGFQIMPATPSMGGFTYDEALGKACWHDSFPDFVGEKGTEEYYENVREALRFICEDLGDDAGIYWQCMMRSISLPFPTITRTISWRTPARALRRGDPPRQAGRPLRRQHAGYNENAVHMLDLIYREGHSFYYVGVDQYFGSWQPGDVENWNGVIDALYERYHLPCWPMSGAIPPAVNTRPSTRT